FRLAHDHVFELFEPLGGDRHDISSLLSNRCPGLLWSRPSIQPVGFDQKTCNIRAIVARSCGWGAGAPPNPSQLLEITPFFTGCEPASAQVCHDRPRTRPGRKGRERLSY